MATSVKQGIKKYAKNKNAKYSLTYKTTYKLRPNNTSYRYTTTKSTNLSYKGT